MAATPWTIRIEGLTDTRRAFKALGEADTPFYLAALNHSAEITRAAIAARAPGSMAGKVDLVGIRGDGINASAVIRVNHPGADSYEFGRRFWYRGFTYGGGLGQRGVRPGRKPKGIQKGTGVRFQSSPGQAEKPFVGVKAGNAAIGAVAPRVHAMMVDAIEREFARVANGGA